MTDKNAIVISLKDALERGTGSLDDLAALLDTARKDVTTAIEEEKRKAEEDKKRRGEEAAKFANRMLQEKITDEDAAMVINLWLKCRGEEKVCFTADNMAELFTECKAALEQEEKSRTFKIKPTADAETTASAMDEFRAAIAELADTLAEHLGPSGPAKDEAEERIKRSNEKRPAKSLNQDNPLLNKDTTWDADKTLNNFLKAIGLR